jgi:FkbM family methyltransferase
MQTVSKSAAMTSVRSFDLSLPEVQILEPCSINTEFYGASAVAAEYCGFKDRPRAARGYWMHGWGPKQYLEFDNPVLYFGLVDLQGKNDYHWVSRQDEENLLRRHGYKKVKAIGMPIVYVAHKPIVRRSGSLLVMPAHSTKETTHEWDFDEYADEIARMRGQFSEVWICIHPSCWEHGYWVDAFKKRGFPLLQGALRTDRNALERLYQLFSTFEYVTTNIMGSHVAYAAYAGAKVSIYGPYAEHRAADYNGILEYEGIRHLMEYWISASSEKVVRQHYPELFCHPLEAEQRIDWGKYEVGFNHKVTPAKLRSLLGWTLRARLAHGITRRISIKARECFNLVVPYRLQQRLEHRAKMNHDAAYRRQYETKTELQRLERVPRYTATSTNLFGGSFELVDSKSFLAQHQAIFDQQIYRFETRKDAPLIIDGGANVGLSVLYFKRAYPQSRVIAFEPDPDLFQVLARNCAAFQLTDIELVPKALWTEDTIVKFDREGADAGRIMADTESFQAVDVSTCRLGDYLDQEVDLLKLDLEGAEVDVLLDCVDRLRNARKIIVEYHSFKGQPQKLHIVTQLLHDAGFRLHVNAGLASAQPLWWRQVHQGMDMRLYIYGFRT